MLVLNTFNWQNIPLVVDFNGKLVAVYLQIKFNLVLKEILIRVLTSNIWRVPWLKMDVVLPTWVNSGILEIIQE